MKPTVLVISPAVPAVVRERLAARFEVLGPVSASDLPALLRRDGARIVGILARGGDPLDRPAIALLPALRAVACISAGTEGIDAGALAERGIAFSTTASVLAEDVADLAIALMLMVRRRLVEADGFVRRGAWPDGSFPLGRAARGRRLGLLGFGGIGQAIARRGEAMGMHLRYCATRPKPCCPLPFLPTPRDLAADSDVLVVCCPGGPATQGLVSAEVIAALGPEGVLVNVARGEVVDEDALIAALASGRLAGAGLDVYRREPHVDARLRQAPNVVLTPHLGSGTQETRAAMADHALAALQHALVPPDL